MVDMWPSVRTRSGVDRILITAMSALVVLLAASPNVSVAQLRFSIHERELRFPNSFLQQFGSQRQLRSSNNKAKFWLAFKCRNPPWSR